MVMPPPTRTGWASINKLLRLSAAKGRPLTRALIEEVVATNDKKRFTFNEDRSMIRASQGHSVSVDLGLSPWHHRPCCSMARPRAFWSPSGSMGSSREIGSMCICLQTRERRPRSVSGTASQRCLKSSPTTCVWPVTHFIYPPTVFG